MKRLITTIIIVTLVNTFCYGVNEQINNNENRLHLFELMNLDKQGDLSKRHNQLNQNREMNESLSDNGLNQKSFQNSPHISRQNTTFSRDGHLYLYTSLNQIWDGSDWVNNSLRTYTYDNDGNQLSYLRQIWGGGDWENYRQYTYTYHTLLDVLDDSSIPTVFTLHQNYPNPFNPVTNIRYDLQSNQHVTLTIYDLNGREINRLVNMNQPAGHKSIQWNATDMQGKPVSAGVYLYQIQAGAFIETRKMVLLK